MNSDEIQILLQILIIFLGIYLAFFKSYFQEKGKNIATKEDVEDITTKVEKIRHEIYIQSESKLSLRTEERNALVDYYIKYTYWLSTIVGASPHTVEEENKTGFKDILKRLSQAKFDFFIAQAKFDIFVGDTDIKNLEGKMLSGVLDMQSEVENVVVQLMRVHSNISIMKEYTDVSLQLEKYKEFNEEQFVLLDRFDEQLLKQYKEVLVDSRTLRDLVYKHIKSLVD